MTGSTNVLLLRRKQKETLINILNPEKQLRFDPGKKTQAKNSRCCFQEVWYTTKLSGDGYEIYETGTSESNSRLR